MQILSHSPRSVLTGSLIERFIKIYKELQKAMNMGRSTKTVWSLDLGGKKLKLKRHLAFFILKVDFLTAQLNEQKAEAHEDRDVF